MRLESKRTNTKILWLILPLFFIALFFSGCGITDDPTQGKELSLFENTSGNAEGSKYGTYRIGVTYADLSNSVWAEEADAIEKLAETLGDEVIILDCSNDGSKQVAQIENFVAMGCNAIIIGAADPGTINSAAQAAMEAGVVVEAFGTRIEYYSVTLLADNEGAGTMLAEKMAEDFKEKNITDPQVAVVNYYGSDDCMTRAESFEKELTDLLPDAKIVAEDSASTADTGMDIAENMIQSNPELDAIFCIGDGAAAGVLQAVMSAGLEDQIGVYSCDGSVDCLSMMAQGAPLKADCSFGTGTQLGEAQLNLVIRVLSNQQFDTVTRLSNTLITPENLAEKVTAWDYQDRIDLTLMEKE